jgi:hypothetical protein
MFSGADDRQALMGGQVGRTRIRRFRANREANLITGTSEIRPAVAKR